ncbi:MAG TPA: DUF2190 family protein [Rhodanobacteraceae bacterium]|nr:DUF2190 family protein [Rhodanobacteraceae bacterium]
MTQKISLLALPVIAAAAIEAERFVTAAGAYPTAATSAFGVSTTKAASGELFGVDVLGTAIVTAGAAIAKNASLEVGSSGKAITRTSTNPIVAVALQAASADGDRIEVLLIPNAA